MINAVGKNPKEDSASFRDSTENPILEATDASRFPGVDYPLVKSVAPRHGLGPTFLDADKTE
jgi:hypothetical protein